jgi:hypothetical protein
MCVCCEHDGVKNEVAKYKTICLTLEYSTMGKQPNYQSKAPMNVQGAMIKLHYVLFANHFFFC